jgi:hypothetical protein
MRKKNLASDEKGRSQTALYAADRKTLLINSSVEQDTFPVMVAYLWKKSTAFYKTRMFITVFTTAHHWSLS